MIAKVKSTTVPEALRPRYEEIITLTDAICQEKRLYIHLVLSFFFSTRARHPI